MPDPYDYTSAFANLPSPQESFLQGVQGGAGIQQLQFGRQQQQAALAQQQQERTVIADLVSKGSNATADDYVKAGLQVPKLSAQFKQFWDMKNEAQQQSELQRMTGWAAAIDGGQPKIASDAMRAQADAIENTAGAPTQESRGLRTKADQVDANPELSSVILKKMMAANPKGKDAIASLISLNSERRADELHTSAVSKANADADTAEADLTLKNLGIVGQQLGALQGKNAKPEQAKTAISTLVARGVIPKEEKQAWLDAVPTDPKQLDAWLGTVRAGGMKPDDQMRYTTPDANTVANNATSRANTAANNATQLEVQDRIATRQAAQQQFKVEHGIKGLTPEQNDALFGENGAVTTGKLDPNKINSRTAAIFADAFLKNPNTDFAKVSSDIAAGRKADTEFATGKAGNSIRSFNVGIAHLDTLGQLADALGNGDMQAINRIGNFVATQTGQPAPTNFNGAKKIVGDEIVKAIVGAGGGVADREEAARIIDGANSPAQLRGAIKTVQELMVGQLGGLEQQYRTTTKRDDFDKYLSPRALEIRKNHGGGGHGAPASGAAPAIPPGWSVKEH